MAPSQPGKPAKVAIERDELAVRLDSQGSEGRVAYEIPADPRLAQQICKDLEVTRPGLDDRDDGLAEHLRT